MSTHKALFLLEKHGNYAVRDTPTPKPGPGELLIEVKATGLNPVDWKIRKYGVFIDKFPTVLGSDVAGDIVGLGEGVEEAGEFKIGDRV